MHAPSRRLLDFPEPGLQAVAPVLPVDQEPAGPRFAAEEGEAENVEGLRLAAPRLARVTAAADATWRPACAARSVGKREI
jgi:hypothetical protein